MASTYTPIYGLEKQADGENSNTWGQKENATRVLVEEAIGGFSTQAVTSLDITLTMTDGVSSVIRNKCIEFTGIKTANRTITVPTTSGNWVFYNNTTGSFTLTVKTSAGSGIVLEQGKRTICYGDGIDIYVADDKSIAVSRLADGTDGELITWDSSGVATTVAVGTSGHVLTSNGAGAAPTFKTAGGLVLLSTTTISSAVANVSITSGIDSTYDRYQIVIDDLKTSSQVGINLLFSYNGGSTYAAGVHAGGISRSHSDTNVVGYNYFVGSDNPISAGLAVDDGTVSSASSFNSTIELIHPSSTTSYMNFTVKSVFNDSSGATIFVDGGGKETSPTSAVNAIRLQGSSGNLTSGTVKLYGIEK